MIGSGLPLPGLAPSSSTPPAASAADAGPVRAQETPAGSADDAPSRFDRMLDEGNTDATAAPAPAPQEAAAEGSVREAEPASTSAPLPDQMLSLLASLATAAPVSTSTPAAATTTTAGMGLQRSMLEPALTPLPGQAAPAAPALPQTTGTADAAAAFAMPALAAGRDRATHASPDAPAAITDLAPLAGTATGTAVAATRDAVPVPVAPQVVTMPADPAAGLDEAFGANVMWMSDQKIGQAEIRVTPDHLGPIDVRLHLDGTKVRAEFLSAQPDVRQAIESGMGRLRDMLGQQGLQLAQADVGHRQSQTRDGAPADTRPGRDEHDEPVLTPAVVRMQRGLLDTYA